MSEISGQNGPADPERFAGRGSAGGQPRGRRPARPRRGLRIALVSLASFVVLLGVAAVGGYAFVNQLAGSIQRIPVKFAKLAGAAEPAGAITVLITGATSGPVSMSTSGSSGLIMLLHIDAGDKGGGVVPIPPQALVQVPGHGQTELNNALTYGGGSLLVQTVEQLTHVQINHYASIDFTDIANLIDAIGGVDVTLPKETVATVNVTLLNETVTKEYTFHAGVNHLTGITAVYYVQQSSLTEEGRVLRQQNLIRAILDKISSQHLLTNPVTVYRVMHALVTMLTLDSNFANPEAMKLAASLDHLSGSGGTFVTAPTHTVSGDVYLDSSESNELWAAIRHDSIAAFAAKYPATVTPGAPS
jgi:LCP family protein required for cell wall assembly